MLDALEEFNRLADRSARKVEAAVFRLMNAAAENSWSGRRDAVEQLGSAMAGQMASADMLGRNRILIEADNARGGERKAGKSAFAMTFVPERMAFPVYDEAVEDLIVRKPELARTAEQVALVYARHGFALAKADELTIVDRVQKAIAAGISEGLGVRQGGELVEGLGDWGRAYAETVYHQNMANAYTAGRFMQANSEDVKDVIGAFEFRSRQDAATRPNHFAAHGTIAPTNDAVWALISPPLGFRCRCQLRMVSRFELERLGLLRQGRVEHVLPPTIHAAGPDPGFLGGRPDRRIYGAA
jgi:SPP1 gp7 family putative phage head morphogenesis protein